MNQSLLAISATGWAKTGRRWTTILATLLAINFLLVIVAVSGFADRAEVAPPSEAATTNTTASIPEALDSSAAEATASTSELDRLPNAGVGAVAPGAEPKVSVDNVLRQSNEPWRRIEGLGSAAADPPDNSQNNAIPEKRDSLVVNGTADSRQPAVIIINPPTTGGVVHYVVDGTVFSLLPAEFHRLEGSRPRRISFHRGDDFDDSERVVSEGVFVFGLSGVGWELRQPPSDVASRLLSTCRSLQTEKQQ